MRRNPDFRYMLDKLKGYDLRVDFPVGTEPPPPARPIGPAAPWGPEHPRSARCGKIPRAESYTAKEVGFVIGVSRRTVIAKLAAKILPGIKVPCTRSRLTTWKWKVLHGPLVAFLRRNQRYSFALGRIQGCESEQRRLGQSRRCSPRLLPKGAPGRPRISRLEGAPRANQARWIQAWSQTC